MAEVTSGFHSLSSKKPPSFSNNGFTISSSSSSSAKHIYDDVFASRPSRKFKSSEFSSFGDDDYADIFGSSKSENGVWESISSSIPIFNIPESEHRRNGGGADYLGVFGGGGDDGLDLPNGEELFDQMKKKAKTSASDSTPRSTELTEATTSYISRNFENGQRPARGFSQSFDGVKHFEHDIEMTPSEPSGATHVVHVHANPRLSREVGSSQTSQTNRIPMIKEDTEVSMGVYLGKQGKHSRNTRSELGANEQKRECDADFQKASLLSESNSTTASHETRQNNVATPSRQVKEGAKVQCNAKDDAGLGILGSTSLQEIGPSQKTQTNGTPVKKDNVELGIHIGPTNKRAEPSRNTYLELKKGELSWNTNSEHGASEWKGEHDDDFQRTSGLKELNPTVALHDSCQESTIIGPSKVVKDDMKVDFHAKHDPMEMEPSDLVANKQNTEHDATFKKVSDLNWSSPNDSFCGIGQASSVVGSSEEVKDGIKAASGPDLGKKLGRHARMTSLDLGGQQQAQQAAAGSQGKARFGSSYSFDASHDPFAARVKLQSSKVVPSSSLPQYFPVESHCKISENSSCKSSGNYMYRDAGDSVPSLDEQLDANSVAAISAAALQRAIEEAEMRIRMAKEFLEREGQGNSKLSFKDTLKLKAGKENSNANEIYDYREKKVLHQAQVESRMQTSYHSERKSVLEPSQVAPLSGGLKKFPKDEKSMEELNVKVTKAIDVDDKREVGEWEAAKHLNQLISGVKNKIVSFMAWQAEPEKKEEPKESEASGKPQSVHTLNDAKVFEMKEAETNQSASVSAYRTVNGESKTGFIQEVTEQDENELMQHNSVVQEKAVHKVDVVPVNEGPTRTNFLFFSFSSDRSWDHTHLDGGENRKTEGTGELGVVNRREEINKVKDEQIGANSEEAIQEGLDDACSRDCVRSLQCSSSGESDGIMEDLCSATGYSRSELTYDEERLNEEHGIVGISNEEHGDDRSEFIHEDNHDSSLSEEFEDDGTRFTYQENRKMSEEFGDDRSEFTCRENEKLYDEGGDNKSENNYAKENEECRDGKSEFTHEESGRPSEDCGDNSSDFTSGDIRLSEDHGVNQSNFTNGEINERGLNEQIANERSNFPCDPRINEECGEEPISSDHCPEAIIATIETEDEREDYGEFEEAENQLDEIELSEEADLVGETKKIVETIEEINGKQEKERDLGLMNDAAEIAQSMDEWEENNMNQSKASHAEETANKVADQVGCTLSEDESEQTEYGFPIDTEVACCMDGSISTTAETVIPDEESEKMMEFTSSSAETEMHSEITVSPNEESEKIMETINPSSELEKDEENPAFTQEASKSTGEESVSASFSSENTVESDGVVHLDGADRAPTCMNFPLYKREADLDCGKKDIDGKGLESESEDICENETFSESAETVDVEEAGNTSDHVWEKCSFEAVHRRRRWFENGDKFINADQPSILEGDGANLEMDQEVLEECDLAGGVEIHADKPESEAPKVTIATESSGDLIHEDNGVNVEATHKRRRWFVNKGEGISEPPSLFGGIKLTSKMEPDIVNELQPRVVSDGFVGHIHTESGDTSNVEGAGVVVKEERSKQSLEATPRRKRWFESGEKVEPNRQERRDQDYKEIRGTEKRGEGKEDMHNKTEPVNEIHRDPDAVNRRKKEKEKEKIAVERAIREARERAFAEARERARREAVEKPKMEGSQRGISGGQEKPLKASSEATSASDKASMEAKLKAERAAVERATAEARERALQKALSEKASHRLREPAGRHQPERNSSFDPKYHCSSSYARSSDFSNKGEKLDGADGESAQRRKARLERQNRTMERAAKALEEKNERDLQAQKEQAARNMLADSVDAEVKRWSIGKEGNLRALLSTLQYILGSDSGWQAISLTDLVAPTAVRKAYKKATLCVHPDKLQQRGATIQQKYICEKVFDLLKEAWSKFNPDER